MFIQTSTTIFIIQEMTEAINCQSYQYSLPTHFSPIGLLKSLLGGTPGSYVSQ